MRKLVVFLHTSLDGYVEGPNGAMDMGWIAYDKDLEGFANEVLRTADTIVWGRHTYEMMHEYWPTVPSDPNATEHELNHAEWIENVEKVVFSKTIDHVEWKNATLVNDNVEAVISELKQRDGGDIVVLGSPRFAHHLMSLNLVDTFKMTVSPTIIGGGLPLFKNINEQLDLKLTSHQAFDSGALGLVYDRK
ncbi:dihydrofolate reductase family protein [Mammaliicoccus sp. Dog046]|uniref:dihydrofolate reductase family protein n=1 Tax=Mammaliicoccus sp. Dog046 TaxID=3034233 RepID=UPI002B25A311|nr:dihydrofolate reductase family protein [Mammaliicoccus sp. Dog046]WQK85611.1 dihydrofolate reductase family protein [Mammaliicoccus sp. Dog046]